MITVDAKNIHTFTFSYGWQLFSGANSLTLSSACSKWGYWKFSNLSFSNFSILWIQIPVKSSGRTYRRSYFYLNNILKLKKESSAKTFITTRATRHPGPQGLTYCNSVCNYIISQKSLYINEKTLPAPEHTLYIFVVLYIQWRLLPVCLFYTYYNCCC